MALQLCGSGCGMSILRYDVTKNAHKHKDTGVIPVIDEGLFGKSKNREIAHHNIEQ